MAPRIKPATEDDSLSYVRMCLYSHSGVGKTKLIGTLDEHCLVMDADPGGETLKAMKSKVHVTRVADLDAISEVYEFLRHEKHNYKMVWWDGITLFMDRMLIDDVLEEAHLRNPQKQERWVPSQREYLIVQNRIMALVRMFAGLPMDFGCTALCMPIELPNGEMIMGPAVPSRNGHMSSKVMGYMNLVTYLYTAREKEGNQSQQVMKLLTRSTDEYHAKDRFQVLPAVVKEPNLMDIMRQIKRSLNAQNSQTQHPSNSSNVRRLTR